MSPIPGVGGRGTAGPQERGLAMITLLATLMILTIISVSLLGLMRTDLTHASIQNAVARSFYIAQAGLEEAKVRLFAAADPAAYTTPDAGVTVPYGSGQFTYWVDAGPATGCGGGLKTLEALGQVGYLARTFSTRVRACGAPGVPFLAALFGVARIQLQGAATRMYLAPYLPGTPGGGGSLGTFAEINFSDNDVRLNALSEEGEDVVTLRDGRFLDYTLFGFTARPAYNPTAIADPAPWLLPAFGDIVKARPTTGPGPNACGTPNACVTVGNQISDVETIPDLRSAHYVHHAYMRGMREEVVPPLTLDAAVFRTAAQRNTANAAINTAAGLTEKRDSVYGITDFYRLMIYLAAHPSQVLQGTVYIEGTLYLLHNLNLGGDAGNVTLAVGGDLILGNNVALTNRHDLATVTGRRTPGIVVLGYHGFDALPTAICGRQRVSSTGRLVLCGGSKLVVDGLVYTEDGMAVEPQASVDQVGAMYHNNRGTANPSFTNQGGTVVLRFDPLALSTFGTGIAILSWQQVR